MLPDDGDDSFQIPPRLSTSIEDDTQTRMSIEAPRRAITDQASARLSQGSTGISDRFANVSDLEPDISPTLRRSRASFPLVQYEGLGDYDYEG